MLVRLGGWLLGGAMDHGVPLLLAHLQLSEKLMEFTTNYK